MSGDVVSLYRARTARETGTIYKDWGGKRSIALVYPNRYDLGMSNLGFQVVYGLLNKRSDVVAERVFLPDRQEMPLYVRSGRPLLSLESQSPLSRFDMVCFSISFENDYPHVLQILDLGRIPVLAAKRKAEDPFVMAGGVTTFLNPEPLADFMDFFLLGEAEANLDLFLNALFEIMDAGLERKEALYALGGRLDSLYAPALYEPGYQEGGSLRSLTPSGPDVPEKIRPARVLPAEYAREPAARSVVVTPDTEFKDRMLVELGRGCGRSCRFCAAGYVYRPPRTRGEDDLVKSVGEALDQCRHLGLVSAAVSDVPGLDKAVSLIMERGGDFSVSSLRADSITPGLLARLKEAGQRTIALAPEAGSERMRAVINKHLSREKIEEAVRMIAEAGDFSIRLYFLIGLPTEESRDVREIVDLTKRIRHHMIKFSRSRGTIGQIRISLNCFVPKPFTPFQWVPLEDTRSLKDKQKRIKKALAREGGIRVSTDLPKWAYLQTLLSMGDRRVGKILLKAHEEQGNWQRAFRSSEVNPDFFVYRPKGLEEVLPWDHIDHGIRKAHLVREYKMALKAEESACCLVGECFRCGVCVDPEGAEPGSR